jgi:ABC-type multidrug transport system fused ATPase/permease subunit
MRGVGASIRTWEIIDKIPPNKNISKFDLIILYSGLLGSFIYLFLDFPIYTNEIFKGDIKFENVSFAYPTRPEQKIFDNLNLVIPGGKILAVVGASGSGMLSV